MSVSIRQHVFYPPPPKVKATVAAPTMSGRLAIKPVRRKTSPPDEIYAHLLDIAKRGLRAPTRDEITDRCGPSGNTITADLARAGRLVIEVGSRNYRVITIEGHTTLRPTRWRPYLRIDTAGTCYWDGRFWKARQR